MGIAPDRWEGFHPSEIGGNRATALLFLQMPAVAHGLSLCSQACTSSPLSQKLSGIALSGYREQMSKWPCQSVSHPNANWSRQLGPAGVGGITCAWGPSTKGGKSFLQEPSPWAPRLHLYETKVHGPLSLSDFMSASLRISREAGGGREGH